MTVIVRRGFATSDGEGVDNRVRYGVWSSMFDEPSYPIEKAALKDVEETTMLVRVGSYNPY